MNTSKQTPAPRKTSELLTEVYGLLYNPEIGYRDILFRSEICTNTFGITLLQSEDAKMVLARHRIARKIYPATTISQKLIEAIPRETLDIIDDAFDLAVWVQRRRREFLCNLISEYERAGD